MSAHDELGCRMKEYYEKIPKTNLMRRTPVVIRIDGCSFHSFTRNFKRPFDDVLIKSMQQTMKYLCENIQGCVLGYHQSDEISLVLIDYQRLNSDAWFDYEVQKICSIAASMATMAFNKYFSYNVQDCGYDCCYDPDNDNFGDEIVPGRYEDWSQYDKYLDAANKGAIFDARCFNIPKEEVTNYFYYRQLDATRNSIQMAGQANFSHKELHGKSCNQIQDMLMTKRGINWNDFPEYKKRGSCCVKNKIPFASDGKTEFVMLRDTEASENTWIIDKKIPIFKGEDRKYIDTLIYVGEE